MTGRSEHGGGEESIRRENDEAQTAEDRRADRLLARWRRMTETLLELTDGPE